MRTFLTMEQECIEKANYNYDKPLSSKGKTSWYIKSYASVNITKLQVKAHAHFWLQTIFLSQKYSVTQGLNVSLCMLRRVESERRINEKTKAWWTAPERRMRGIQPRGSTTLGESYLLIFLFTWWKLLDGVLSSAHTIVVTDKPHNDDANVLQ